MSIDRFKELMKEVKENRKEVILNLVSECPYCGEKFKDKQKVVTAGSLTEIFGYVFCNYNCRDEYIASK